MSMHKALNSKDDIQRLYVSNKKEQIEKQRNLKNINGGKNNCKDTSGEITHERTWTWFRKETSR